MRIIYKYEVKVGINYLDLPEGCRIIKFGQQGGFLPKGNSLDGLYKKLFVWVLQNPKVKTEKWRLDVVGTGQELSDTFERFRHFGTWVSDDYVWHLFAAKQKKRKQNEVENSESSRG